MIPTMAVRNAAAELLAADPDTLGADPANKVHLYMNNVTPAESSILADFTEASFDGHTAIPTATDAQACGIDPATADSVIDLIPGAGGFRWETSGMTNLPQTIYGYYLTDSTSATLLAAQRFATPVTLTETGQAINIGDPSIRMLANCMS